MSAPRTWTLWKDGLAEVATPIAGPLVDHAERIVVVERAAYDRLMAERDEAVALLQRFDNEEQDDTLGVDLVAFLACLDKPREERP